MADSKPPSLEDTPQTIASIESQLDDLLDEIEAQQSESPADAPSQAARPTPASASNELDEIADAFEVANEETPGQQAIDAEPTAEAIAPMDAQNMLAEVNDALGEIEQDPQSPAEQTTPVLEPEPVAAQATDEAEDVPTDKAPAEDLDAEIEALLAEQPIADDVLATAESIAKDDEASAEEQQAALALRADLAKQNLMSLQEDAGPQAPPETQGVEAVSAPGPSDAEGDTNTQAQIAQEIEDLLTADAGEPTPDESAAEEPSIGQIDQMLAEEIDTDDELIGDFQSVQDIAEGIAPSGESEAIDLSGEPEGASASDVASELDTQPEALAQAPAADAEESIDTAQSKAPKWKGLAKVAERVALRVCWTLNWPLRQNPVTPQWRSTIGYVALLNLAVGSALFAVGVAKLVF